MTEETEQTSVTFRPPGEPGGHRRRKLLDLLWNRDAAYVAGIFLSSKAIVLLIALLAPLLITPGPKNVGRSPDVTMEQYTRRWDVGWYREIATQGYSFQPGRASNVAFFPLLPLLIRGLMSCGLSAAAAGLIVSNACTLAALALLYRLMLDEFGCRSLAQHATALLAFSPGAVWFFLAYTEAPFVALCIGIFVAVRRERFLPGMALGILAGLTRPNGLVLAAPILAAVAPQMLRAWRERKAGSLASIAACVAAPVVGHAMYLIYLQVAFGNWLANHAAEDSGWHAHVSLSWDVIWQKIPGIGLHLFDNPTAFREQVAWSWTLAVFACGFALVALWERKAPAWYAAFIATFMALFVFIDQGGPVYSIARFTAANFPLYIAVALFAEQRPWARTASIGAFASAFAIVTFIVFAGYMWV